MQLREEIKLSANSKECPVNDWMCKFFENGGCRLYNAEAQCSYMKNRNDRKIKVVLE